MSLMKKHIGKKIDLAIVCTRGLLNFHPRISIHTTAFHFPYLTGPWLKSEVKKILHGAHCAKIAATVVLNSRK